MWEWDLNINEQVVKIRNQSIKFLLLRDWSPMLVKHLNAAVLLFETQCADSFVPFMHLVTKDKRHIFCQEMF